MKKIYITLPHHYNEPFKTPKKQWKYFHRLKRLTKKAKEGKIKMIMGDYYEV